MCVRVCVCVCGRMHVCMWAWACACVCVSMSMYTWVLVCLCISLSVYIFARVFVRANVSMSTSELASERVYVHTCVVSACLKTYHLFLHSATSLTFPWLLLCTMKTIWKMIRQKCKIQARYSLAIIPQFRSLKLSLIQLSNFNNARLLEGKKASVSRLPGEENDYEDSNDSPEKRKIHFHEFRQIIQIRKRKCDQRKRMTVET